MNIFDVAKPGDRVYYADYKERKRKRYVSECGYHLVDENGMIMMDFNRREYREDGKHQFSPITKIVKVTRKENGEKKVVWERC